MTSDWFCGGNCRSAEWRSLIHDKILLVTQMYSSAIDSEGYLQAGADKRLGCFSWVCSSRGNHPSSAISAGALVGTCINLQNWDWIFSISSDLIIPHISAPQHRTGNTIVSNCSHMTLIGGKLKSFSNLSQDVWDFLCLCCQCSFGPCKLSILHKYNSQIPLFFDGFNLFAIQYKWLDVWP